MSEEIIINDVVFKIKYQRKQIKNVYFSLKGQEIVVKAPLFYSLNQLYNILLLKQNLIYKQYLKSKTKINYKYNLYDKYIYIFGIRKTINYVHGKNKVQVFDEHLVISYLDDDFIGKLYKELNKKLEIVLQELLNKYIFILKKYGYRQIPKITIRRLKSKWGECFYKRNEIRFSSFLVHYNKEIIAYIMVHELVHFIIPNHSKDFYKIISEVLPNYKDIVKDLN